MSVSGGRPGQYLRLLLIVAGLVLVMASATGCIQAGKNSSSSNGNGGSGGGPTPTPANASSTPTAATPDVTPTPEPTPVPTPKPTKAPITVTLAQLVAVCSGHPIAGLPAYAGSPRPLVVIDTKKKALYSGAANTNYNAGVWTGDMLEAVVCVPPSKATQIKSCGWYYSDYTGWGEIVLMQYSTTVTIMSTKTGAKIGSKALKGNAITCHSSYPLAGFIGLKSPWRIFGGQPTSSAINAYAQTAD